jgi:hypothetical protein
VKPESSNAGSGVEKSRPGAALGSTGKPPASGMPHTPAQGEWIPSMNGDECPHRPEWTCPEHAECRACECGCNTYLADLEEPDLTLIPADLVVCDPEICSGRPTMRGTRILASRIAGELAAGTSWGLLHEWYPSMPVPAAQSGAGDAQPSGTASDRDTGEPRLQISTQGIDGEPLSGPEIISRTLVLAFGTRHHDRPFIREIAEALDNALRPVHEREAPGVDGWHIALHPDGVGIYDATDHPVLTGAIIPLGAVLAFIADNPLTERTTT